MELVINGRGQVHCLYGELIELATVGSLRIRRASHVEPDAQGQWHADLAPLSGPRLGPFASRSGALAAEEAWLAAHWLACPDREPAEGDAHVSAASSHQ